MKNIKDLVKNNKVANFIYYSEGNLYYETECGFVFPVPITDVGDGVFNASERAMLLMRYIRKQLEKPEIKSIDKKEGNVLFVRFNKNNLIYDIKGFEFPIETSENNFDILLANESEEKLAHAISKYKEIVEKEKSLT